MTHPSSLFSRATALTSGGVRRAGTLLCACLLALGTLLAQSIPVTTADAVARAHYTIAERAAMHADLARATAAADEAIAADPKFARALMLRAKLGPAAEAKPFEDRALAAMTKLPADEQAFLRTATLRDPAEEAAALEPLAAKYPKDTWLGFVYGFALQSAGDYAGAKAAFDGVLALDPNHPGALNGRGYNAIALGDDAAAERAFRAYLAAFPDEANPYDSMGEMLMLAGRYDEAVPYFRQALERDPAMGASARNLVRIEIAKQLDRYERADIAKDAKTVASLYSERCRVFPHDRAPVVGREALEAMLAEQYAAREGAYTVAFTTDDFTVADETTAFEVGTMRSTLDGKPSAGQYMSCWALIDGEWLIVRDIWTNYTPDPVTVASK